MANRPNPRNVAAIKSALLHPATTSHFEVFIPTPPVLSSDSFKALKDNNVTLDRDKLHLLCSDAILPGSQLATHDITGDYHGTTHRHAYRRQYDDRIDLTFYVNATSYLPIRYFEVWMKYIAGEQVAKDKGKDPRPVVEQEHYFYRMNYPKNYICNTGFEIKKFEKSSYSESFAKGDKGDVLTYKFVNVFPIAIASMPVSYDSSSLLKCTVSLSYIRYYLDPTQPPAPTSDASQNQALTPEQQANFNSTANNLSGTGALSTSLPPGSLPGLAIGGRSTTAAQASGNTVKR